MSQRCLLDSCEVIVSHHTPCCFLVQGVTLDTLCIKTFHTFFSSLTHIFSLASSCKCMTKATLTQQIFLSKSPVCCTSFQSSGCLCRKKYTTPARSSVAGICKGRPCEISSESSVGKGEGRKRTPLMASPIAWPFTAAAGAAAQVRVFQSGSHHQPWAFLRDSEKVKALSDGGEKVKITVKDSTAQHLSAACIHL